MNNKQKHRLKKLLKRKYPKLFWETPLWIIKKSSGLLTQDHVQKCKLVSEDSYMQVRKERYLQGLDKR